VRPKIVISFVMCLGHQFESHQARPKIAEILVYGAESVGAQSEKIHDSLLYPPNRIAVGSL